LRSAACSAHSSSTRLEMRFSDSTSKGVKGRVMSLRQALMRATFSGSSPATTLSLSKGTIPSSGTRKCQMPSSGRSVPKRSFCGTRSSQRLPFTLVVSDSGLKTWRRAPIRLLPTRMRAPKKGVAASRVVCRMFSHSESLPSSVAGGLRSTP